MEERFKNAPCGFLSIDYEGYIVAVNDTFLIEMNYEQDELVGKHVEIICRPPARMIFHSYFYPTIHLYGKVRELFVKLMKKSGEEVPFILNARRFEAEAAYRVDIVMLPMIKRMEYEQVLRQTKVKVEEILKEKEAAHQELQALYAEIKEKKIEVENMNEHLMVLSNTDKLTNIPNRRYFHHRLDEIVFEYEKTQKPFSLMMMDIDHFKRVNDRYGHQIGDQVLIQVAAILSENLPENAVVARYGGEEFVILLPGMSENDAMATAEILKDNIQHAHWDIVNRMTISAGIATFTEDDDPYSIITKADQALYLSKERGRNCATHFNMVSS